MFTAGAGRQSEAEVSSGSLSPPLPGWESEVCLLMGHTDCCLLAWGMGVGWAHSYWCCLRTALSGRGKGRDGLEF